jgi:hypothetical protein
LPGASQAPHPRGIIFAAPAYAGDSDLLVPHLTGSLKRDPGGTPIFGRDVVVILKERRRPSGLALRTQTRRPLASGPIRVSEN